MMRKLAAFFLLVLCAGAALGSAATVIVTPGDHTAGGAATCAPLSGCSSIDRHQQRYASSQFAAWAGPELITEIAFRPDETTRGSNGAVGGPIAIVFAHVEITFSTLDGPLAATFALNLGPDATTVYSGGLSLSSPNAPPPTPGLAKTFDFIIPLATPFPYDPSAGDLVVEFWNHSGESSPFGFATDAVSSPNQSVRGGAAAATGTLSNFALITRFTSSPAPVAAAPEPGALSLVLFGLAALSLRRGRRRPDAV